MTYPNDPGFKARDTAAAAADAMRSKAQVLRVKVYAALQGRDFTADEIAEWLGETPFSIRPRVSELAKRNKVFDSGKRRKNTSGHSAIVWSRVNPAAFDSLV